MAVAGLNLPYILLKTAFKESVEISSKFSPLEEGLMWIKYVDCTPIFTTEKIIEKNKKSFEKFLKTGEAVVYLLRSDIDLVIIFPLWIPKGE